jgi:hypothetical protein
MNRYGAVESRTDTGTNTWIGQYSFKEYNVRVAYQNNISVCEMVWPSESRAFSDDERDTLRTNIGGAGSWVEDAETTSLTVTTWTNANSQAVACEKEGITGPTLLIICTHEYDAQVTARKKEEQKADGF